MYIYVLCMGFIHAVFIELILPYNHQHINQQYTYYHHCIYSIYNIYIILLYAI